MAYDGWTGSYLPMYVLKLIFEEELGYQVQISDQLTIPAAFEAVASEKADIFTSAWFPARDSTIDKYPNLVKLGRVYGGKDRDAFEGLMLSADVAEQFGVIHVNDLADPALVRALDRDGDGTGNLIGCPPDWVCSARIPEILADYGLSGLYEVEEQQNEEQLLATIGERVSQGQPALFYSYQPVAFPEPVPVMDLAVWLKGTEAYLALAFDRIVVRDDFLASCPAAAKILQQYNISGADISASMERIIAAGDGGSSPEFLAQLARDRIAGNQDQVKAWTEGVTRRPESIPRTVTPEALTMGYSTDKEDLILDLVTEFNLSRPRDVLPVHPIRWDPAEMMEDAVTGLFSAISPDSSV